VLCCAVLCCAVLCCAVLCCAVQEYILFVMDVNTLCGRFNIFSVIFLCIFPVA